MDATGECFITVWELSMRRDMRMLDLLLPAHRAPHIVHGVVNGQQHLTGFQFGHAWIEVEGVCIDGCTGSVITKEVYYKAGNITDVTRYRLAEALAEVEAKGHAGPWVERYELVIDPDGREGTVEDGEVQWRKQA